MAKGKSTPIVFYDWFFEDLDSMTPEECKQFLCILRDFQGGKEIEMPTERFMLMKMRRIIEMLQNNKEKYDAAVQKKTEAVNRRWQKIKGSIEESTPPQEEVLVLEEVPIEEKPKRKKSAPVEVEKVKELFNEICGDTYGCIKSISVVRGQKIKARAKDFGEDYLAKFEEIFRRMMEAPFCLEGAKQWCNFDWIITNDNNYVKLLEGRYDRPSNNNGNRPLTKFELNKLSAEQAANAIANSCIADFERERGKASRVPIMQL